MTEQTKGRSEWEMTGTVLHRYPGSKNGWQLTFSDQPSWRLEAAAPCLFPPPFHFLLHVQLSRGGGEGKWPWWVITRWQTMAQHGNVLPVSLFKPTLEDTCSSTDNWAELSEATTVSGRPSGNSMIIINVWSQGTKQGSSGESQLCLLVCPQGSQIYVRGRCVLWNPGGWIKSENQWKYLEQTLPKQAQELTSMGQGFPIWKRNESNNLQPLVHGSCSTMDAERLKLLAWIRADGAWTCMQDSFKSADAEEYWTGLNSQLLLEQKLQRSIWTLTRRLDNNDPHLFRWGGGLEKPVLPRAPRQAWWRP